MITFLVLDTDSVFFITRPDLIERDPKTGVYLGDLTDELKPGEYIVEFVSLGPKSYAFKTSLGREVIKLKGVTLNGATEGTIDFKKLLELLKDPTSTVSVPQRTLKRDMIKLRIEDVSLQKRVRYTMDKRILLQDGSWNTYPYGFYWQQESEFDSFGDVIPTPPPLVHDDDESDEDALNVSAEGLFWAEEDERDNEGYLVPDTDDEEEEEDRGWTISPILDDRQ
jgi:hypothetical protein